MTLNDTLNHHYPGRVSSPADLGSIPSDGFMVYILSHKGTAIVLGHGKKNRASVIFDNLNRKTPAHIKSLLVRVNVLFYGDDLERYIIACRDKAEAREIEKRLHPEIGGNSCEIPEPLMEFLVADLNDNFALLFLKLAICSSFDGLSDLKKWRHKKLIPDSTWGVLSHKLQLQELGWT
jgi:hypothetical protein